MPNDAKCLFAKYSCTCKCSRCEDEALHNACQNQKDLKIIFGGQMIAILQSNHYYI